MEAKDTVMTDRQLAETKSKATFGKYYWNNSGITTAEHLIAEAQAEISFKAGQESKRREIEELLGKIACELDAGQTYSDFYSAIHDLYHTWQAQLKERGNREPYVKLGDIDANQNIQGR